LPWLVSGLYSCSRKPVDDYQACSGEDKAIV
jgi:hypothetical protein